MSGLFYDHFCLVYAASDASSFFPFHIPLLNVIISLLSAKEKEKEVVTSIFLLFCMERAMCHDAVFKELDWYSFGLVF